MADMRDICTAALREIGIFAAGEVAPYDDANDAMSALNRLIEQWAAERLEIFTITRTPWAITSGTGQYVLGLAPTNAVNVSDGFDTAWAGAPANWTAQLTGTGAIANDTVIYQDGGHSVQITGGAAGSAILYRDFTVNTGALATIALYLQRDISAGTQEVRIQNLTTTKYLTSAGTWQAATANLFGVSHLAFTKEALTFQVESLDIVGANTCILRISFFADLPAGRFAWFDTFTFVASGALNIIIPRPVFIDHVNLVDTAPSPDLETPLTMLTEDAWAAIGIKDLTATRPTAWYYNPTFPNGTLNLWPIPTDTNLRGAIYVPTQVSTFASLSDTVSLPPGYERMFVKNLALELLPSYGRQPSPALVQQASDSKAAVRRANRRLTDLSFPASALIGNAGPGAWDIRSGP